MREIKYRYYCEEEKKMFPVYVIRFDDKDFSMINIKIGDCFHARPVTPTNKDHLIQYTGLKDKNGKEIYEGYIGYYDDEKRSETPFCDDFTNRILYQMIWLNEDAEYNLMLVRDKDESHYDNFVNLH